MEPGPEELSDGDMAPAKCKPCGKPFVEHLGLQGTCAELQSAQVRMQLQDRLLRLLLPERKQGCLCNACLIAEIAARTTSKASLR